MIKYKLNLAILLLAAIFVVGIAPRTGNAQTGSDGEATPTTVVTPVCEAPDTGQGIVLIPVVESAHPYANNHDDLEIIPNVDVQAEATRLFFSRLELEDGVDWLILMDAQDGEIQRITGNFPDGLLSEPIPGNLAKVRLVTDTSVPRWGYALEGLESMSMPSLLYSSHPYPHNSDLQWNLTNLDPAAEGTRLHFSCIDLEENVDWLVIMDDTETPLQWITGAHPEGFWTNSVPGIGVIVKLITDTSVNGWGFNIDNLESAPPDLAIARPESNGSLAKSAHPYLANTVETWTVVNPNPAAVFSKVHFTGLDISSGDNLVLFDGDDNRIQVFGRDTQLTDFWSDDIPGRVVKIQLSTGGSWEAWGFRIDQVADGEKRASLAKSAHPYLANTVETWTVVNPNPAAVFSKVHFTGLDISSGDNLVLFDGDDNRIQVFGQDTQLTDFWSDDIPGRVVKIQLSTGGSWEAWGFRIDQVADGEKRASLAESAHPYLANTVETWTVVNPNPAAVFSKVHFTGLDISSGDNLVLFDGDDNQIQVFGQGTQQTDFWSDDIPGRVVNIQLSTGGSWEAWGFRIDDIAPRIDTEPIPAFVNGIYVYVGQPGDIYVNDVFKGHASTPGDYRITLPGLGDNVITLETLFHSQEIVVNTDENGMVRAQYREPEPK